MFQRTVLIYTDGSRKSSNQSWYITAVLKESKNWSNSPITEDFVLKSISLQVWCHQEIIPMPVSWQAVIQQYCILRVSCLTKLDDKTLLLLSNMYGNLPASCHRFFCFHRHCHASTSTKDHCAHIKIFDQWKQVTRPITNPICRFFQVAAMTYPEPTRLLYQHILCVSGKLHLHTTTKYFSCLDSIMSLRIVIQQHYNICNKLLVSAIYSL